MSDYERSSHIRSPDGSFRIEQSWRSDDRAPEWQRTCIIAEPGGRILVDLPLFEVAGEPQFPGPGKVLLTLQHRYGQQARLTVNIAEETFTVGKSEAAQPLAQLSSRLAELIAASAITPRPPVRRGTALDLLSAIGGSMLVTGGLLMTLIGSAHKDRLMGLVGIAFFGACTVLPMLGLQRRWPWLVPHVPLIAVFAEIPWAMFCLAVFLFITGNAPFVIGRVQMTVIMGATAMPVVFGVLWAMVAGSRGLSRGAIARISLLSGGLACSAVIGWFAWQMYE